MLSKGDDNFPSGVLSKGTFNTSQGLTLELLASFEFTGQHWQELEAAFVAPSDALLPGDERAPAAQAARWWFSGSSESYALPHYTCNGFGGGGIDRQTWPIQVANAGWHEVSIQIRPDGYFECYLDGAHLGSWLIPERLRADSLALYLGGRSQETQTLIGPVFVSRGLRR